MYDVTKFIEFALSHAKRASVPEGAKLLVPLNKVGVAGEWEYEKGLLLFLIKNRD